MLFKTTPIGEYSILLLDASSVLLLDASSILLLDDSSILLLDDSSILLLDDSNPFLLPKLLLLLGFLKFILIRRTILIFPHI